MREWCAITQDRLESLYLRGRITFDQYLGLAEYALSLILQVESGQYDWGVIEAEEQFTAVLIAQEAAHA